MTLMKLMVQVEGLEDGDVLDTVVIEQMDDTKYEVRSQHLGKSSIIENLDGDWPKVVSVAIETVYILKLDRRKLPLPRWGGNRTKVVKK